MGDAFQKTTPWRRWPVRLVATAGESTFREMVQKGPPAKPARGPKKELNAEGVEAVLESAAVEAVGISSGYVAAVSGGVVAVGVQAIRIVMRPHQSDVVE